MELAAFVPVTLLKRGSVLACRQSVDLVYFHRCVYEIYLSCGKSHKVLHGQRSDFSEQTDHDPANLVSSDSDVKKHLQHKDTTDEEHNTPDSLALCEYMWFIWCVCVYIEKRSRIYIFLTLKSIRYGEFRVIGTVFAIEMN